MAATETQRIAASEIATRVFRGVAHASSGAKLLAEQRGLNNNCELIDAWSISTRRGNASQ
jgi:hypothetical protein